MILICNLSPGYFTDTPVRLLFSDVSSMCVKGEFTNIWHAFLLFKTPHTIHSHHKSPVPFTSLVNVKEVTGSIWHQIKSIPPGTTNLVKAQRREREREKEREEKEHERQRALRF